MSVDIEKLEELTKAITPLPWRFIDKGHIIDVAKEAAKEKRND